MRLRSPVSTQEPHPIFVHSHNCGFPEYRGWKVRQPVHEYLVARGITYTIHADWIGTTYYVEIVAEEIGDDDLVYLSMKYLSEFALTA